MPSLDPSLPAQGREAGLGGPARHATPDDAPCVHALLTEAFANDLLPFTIYRAPQSVARLAALAAEGAIRVVGDLEGVAIAAGDHLAYLAVAQASRGKGLGRLLIEEFHTGRDAATLDVHADNPARRLYERLGYRPEKESFGVRIPLQTMDEPPETWKVALCDEMRDGFAAIDHEGMRIGLLDRTALRLLDLGGRTFEAGFEALARIGFAGRRELILTGLDEAPRGYETIQVVRSLRMRRNG